MATTLADYFAGVTGRQTFSQAVALEMIPQMRSVTDEDGNTKTYITGYTRKLYTADYETRTYVFEGVPVALTNSLTGKVTVKEVDDTSHTVNFVNYVDHRETGPIFERDNNQVNVIRLSPHLRTVEVTRRVARLRENGTIIQSAPPW